MARSVKQSKRRELEREIAELRAAMVEVAGVISAGEQGISELSHRAADLPGMAAVLHREVSADVLKIEEVPAIWRDGVEAMIALDSR